MTTNKIPTKEVPTPALLLDLVALDKNIDAMATWCRESGVSIRPHAKVHKSPDIARRQLAAGAIGLTTATVYEAESVFETGCPEILIANEVVGGTKLRHLVELAGKTAVIVAVDDADNARDLSSAARAAGVSIGALVDVDVGMHRCGVRSVAGKGQSSPTLSLASKVSSYVGSWDTRVTSCSSRTRLEGRSWRRRPWITWRWLQRRCAIGARGTDRLGRSTNTHDMTGVHPAVTELQAGTYAVMDTGYADLAPRFTPALYIAARVVSRQGQRAVLDCGTKVVSTDLKAPTVPKSTGVVREVHEEHMLIDLAPRVWPGRGRQIDVSVGYTGGTVNMHDGYYVVEGDYVVDVWPIRARGAGRRPAAGPTATELE